ncbi:MAG: MerR family transcriptional regulator [Chloroflexota bacterium]
MTEERQYSIGETVTQLQGEFPDLTLSSLRFLEKEGLLQPQRTQGGHRLYSDEDIARLRLIKRLQSQRYYPLETIRHMLGKLKQAKNTEAGMAFLESLYTPLSYDPDFKPLSREGLSERTSLSPADILRLEEMGLLFPYANGNGLRYDEDDLKMAELVARELKLSAVVDDFAPLGAAMRALVQEEFNLFRKLAGNDNPPIERAQQLRETADLVHALLRAKLYRKMIQNKGKKQ